jgi:hypothetical protein
MKSKTTMLLLTFFAGALIGAGVFWLSCNYCCKTSCCPGKCEIPIDTAGIDKISLETASAYYQNYIQDPVKVDTLKAITISEDEFKAMKLIAMRDSTVRGFRIYMGKIDSVTYSRIMVGTGTFDILGNIYSTSAKVSRVCPPICDIYRPFFGGQ